jgi:hypothetical protein
LQKTDTGNFEFGTVTYIVDTTAASHFFIAPFDTGVYARDYAAEHAGEIPFGTLDHQLHLLQPHFETLRRDGAPPDYSLGHLLQRWYGGTPKVPMLYPYFEVEWSASAWVPEGLLYIVLSFSNRSVGKKLVTSAWGNALGASAESWCRTNDLPLVWADGDNSGMLLDAYANEETLAHSIDITPAMVTAFRSAWTSHVIASFASVLGSMDKALHLSFPSYLKREQADLSSWAPTARTSASTGAGRLSRWSNGNA